MDSALLNEGSPTLEVPFIAGDKEGAFTQELVRAIAASGLVLIQNKNADYRLVVKIIDTAKETIGYRYAKEKISGEVAKNLVSSEGRKSLTISATVYEGRTDKVAFGPYLIESGADFDYLAGDSFQDLTFINRKGSLTTVLPFSLGQLEPDEAAFEAAGRPLYAALARKIVDALLAEW